MKRLLLAAVLGIWATGAIAHSALEGTIPANEALLTESPSEVLMDFKADIRLTRVALTHADHPSVDLDLGTQTTFGQEFVMPFEDMGSGEYVIEWRGLGADGHALTGSFSFAVE